MFEYYSGLGGYGLRYILQKIKLRGLPIGCLEEKIALWREEGQEYNQAEVFVQRKYSPEQRATEGNKIARSLAGRGFAPDAIIAVVTASRDDT